jgi:hypothetical protein
VEIVEAKVREKQRMVSLAVLVTNMEDSVGSFQITIYLVLQRFDRIHCILGLVTWCFHFIGDNTSDEVRMGAVKIVHQLMKLLLHMGKEI